MEKCYKKHNQQAKVKAHGTISISMRFTALLLAMFVLFKYSILIAVVYILAIGLFLYLVASVYCSKCQTRDNCNHLFIGSLSKVISEYKDESYTSRDIIIGAAIPFVIVIALPQFWLFKNLYYFIAYWILFVIAGLEVSLFVCSACANKKCMMCKGSK